VVSVAGYTLYVRSRAQALRQDVKEVILMVSDTLIVIATAVAVVADLLAVGEVVWRLARRLCRKPRAAPKDGS
jgi:hypothetical protein